MTVIVNSSTHRQYQQELVLYDDFYKQYMDIGPVWEITLLCKRNILLIPFSISIRWQDQNSEKLKLFVINDVFYYIMFYMLGKFYEMFEHDMHNLYSNFMHLKWTISTTWTNDWILIVIRFGNKSLTEWYLLNNC